MWDLEQQRCVETVVGHRAEVWDFCVTPEQDRLVTISSAADMKVWKLRSLEDVDDVERKEREERERSASSVGEAEEAEDIATFSRLTLMGPIRRVGTERGVAVKFSRSGRFMGCHGTGKVQDFFFYFPFESLLFLLFFFFGQKPFDTFIFLFCVCIMCPLSKI